MPPTRNAMMTRTRTGAVQRRNHGRPGRARATPPPTPRVAHQARATSSPPSPPPPVTLPELAQPPPVQPQVAPGDPPQQAMPANMVPDSMVTAVVQGVMEAMRAMRGEWGTERGDQGPWSPMADSAIQPPNTSARSSTSTADAPHSSSPPQVQASQASANSSREYVPQLPSIPFPGTAWAAQGGMQSLQAPQAPSLSTPGTAWAVQGQIQDPQASQAPPVPTPVSAWGAQGGMQALQAPQAPSLSTPGTAWAVQGQIQDPQASQAPPVPTPVSAWAAQGGGLGPQPLAPTAFQTLYRQVINAEGHTIFEPIQVPLPPTYLQGQPSLQHQGTTPYPTSAHGSTGFATPFPAPPGGAAGSQDLLTDIRVSANVPQGRGRFIDKVSVPMDSLDHLVPQKVRDKIWAREYVDLAALLLEDEQEMELRICSKSDKPAFKMVPSHKKDITSISLWHKAFRRYAAIYLRKFPAEQEGILIYMDIISELAEDDEDWVTYDKRFRKNHASGRESYGNINVPMYIRAAKTTFRRRAHQGPDADRDGRKKGRQTRAKHPSGYCFTFHDGNRCRGCDFKHECYRCEGSHPASKCPKTKGRSSEGRRDRNNTN